ncbi:MAG: hypothetical protein WAO58_12340 [Fimbriimonadaceae bacterium]
MKLLKRVRILAGVGLFVMVATSTMCWVEVRTRFKPDFLDALGFRHMGGEFTNMGGGYQLDTHFDYYSAPISPKLVIPVAEREMTARGYSVEHEGGAVQFSRARFYKGVILPGHRYLANGNLIEAKGWTSLWIQRSRMFAYRVLEAFNLRN